MKADKDLYRELRELPALELWQVHVPRFDQLSPKERGQQVALVRAVGVVFADSRNPDMKAAVKQWMKGLLQDPNEKIRRYAAAAIPKLGGDAEAEKQLLNLLKDPQSEREKKQAASSLEKIGGRETLKAVQQWGEKLVSEQKVRASVARQEGPSGIKLDAPIPKLPGLRIHLRCRTGLESIVADEVRAGEATQGKFRVVELRSEFVVVEPMGSFTLAELYRYRCFDTVSFSLGTILEPTGPTAIAHLAKLIAAPMTEKLVQAVTDGAWRYRLSFLADGNHEAAVKKVSEAAFALNPRLLNDARQAPWSVDVFFTANVGSAELRPRVTPDPRLYYRTQAVKAASHPPLAACLARIAGKQPHEVVWDPFCGSGLELIEAALFGQVAQVVGTDIDPVAVAMAQANFQAAQLPSTVGKFYAADFRNYAQFPELARGRVSLIISNPPLGRKVRVPHLHGLFADLFKAASEVLRPGGRLVFINPLRLESTDSSLRRELRRPVDLGGYECRLEVYRKY
jgi:SAM-dependent methyltransferase